MVSGEIPRRAYQEQQVLGSGRANYHPPNLLIPSLVRHLMHLYWLPSLSL